MRFDLPAGKAGSPRLCPGKMGPGFTLAFNTFLLFRSICQYCFTTKFLDMKSIPIFILLWCVLHANTTMIMARSGEPANDADKLVVLWTSGDPDVAEKVALLYAHAARTKHWFGEVVLVVWGPSAKLLSENLELQEKVRAMQHDGVVLEACVVCADSYQVTGELRTLGFDVKGMGEPLTNYLKGGAKVLTF
jgi:hypothetical protein